MSVQAKCLVQGRLAPDTATSVYVATGKRTIIDKFSATNIDGSSRTLTVHLVPAGGTAGDDNVITKDISIASKASVDLPEIKSHTLNPGDFIAVAASVADKISIRASGREVTG